MANRKSKGKNNGRNASPSAVQKSSAISISEEDAALLEKAKQAWKAGELDLAEYRRLLEEDLEKEIENKRKEQETQLGKSKETFEREYTKSLDEKHKTLKKDVSDLEKTKKELEKSVSGLEGELSKISDKISDADKKAEGIIGKAEKEAENIA